MYWVLSPVGFYPIHDKTCTKQCKINMCFKHHYIHMHVCVCACVPVQIVEQTYISLYRYNICSCTQMTDMLPKWAPAYKAALALLRGQASCRETADEGPQNRSRLSGIWALLGPCSPREEQCNLSPTHPGLKEGSTKANSHVIQGFLLASFCVLGSIGLYTHRTSAQALQTWNIWKGPST